ncbi:MAG: KR domain-containing protein, partial [Myxococcota bacterium]|nr:KR domain-containing protein [Myxococcota bacterium]
QADATSLEDMSRVVAQGEAQFGPIQGVVHTAGILDDGPSLQKTFESAESVFAAKVESAYVLEHLFGERPLDIFVHFSSQASLRPSMGQVDYSSANAVLDRLSIRRSQRQPGLSCAMGWGAWRDAGMAWEYKTGDVNQTSLFRNVVLDELQDEVHPSAHSLLQDYQYFANGDVLFDGRLVRGEHWITVEHLIGGRPVASATTVIEMFRAGYVEAFDVEDAIEITDLALIKKFGVDDVTDYQILYLMQDDYCQVELRIRMQGEGAEWQTASTARIASIPNRPTLSPETRADLFSVREEALGPYEPPICGPRWTCDWALVERERGAAAKLALQSEFTDEVSDFGLHPAIFDRCIHTLTEHFTGILLPYSCERLRIYGEMPATALTYGYHREPGVDETLDIFITDLEGNLLVEIEGYMARDYESMFHKRADAEEKLEYDAQVDHRLVLDTPGNFESFRLEAQAQSALEPDEIRIRVKAAGLNFRDVLSALGQLPEGDPSREMRGSECTGTVIEVGEEVGHLAVGDAVIALSNHSFSTNVVTKGHMATLLPENLSYTDGAGVPITFLTVDYALNEAARLKAGERILIHAGAGGIGLAAIQFAQSIGAEIYATAGQDFKRDYLRSIGVEHVLDSRSLDFVEGINELTDGEGVDVVLNALAGEFIPASMSLLKPFGRFVEIGKKDIYADTQMGLYPFRNNLSYYGVDLGQFSVYRKDDLLKMFERLMLRFSSGELSPSPVREFPLEQSAKGFEYLARTQHIGKVVFTVEQNMNDADRVVQRFNSRFGTGIGMREGLEVFDRMIGSDESPAQVMIAADALDSQARIARHQAGGSQRRLVDTEYRDPETTTEELLKQIWENTLGITPIGVDDDFAELGGDSINAIMLQVSVNETFNLDLTLAVLLSHPTIAILGKLVDDRVES